MKEKHSLLAEAKARLGIPELWERLGLPGQPRRHGRSPFREDRSPSFSIFADGQRWRDFATGEHGDAADFLACAMKVSPQEGARELIRMAGISSPDRTERFVRMLRYDANIKEGAFRAKKPVAASDRVGRGGVTDGDERAARRARWPVLEACTEEEIAALAHLRGVSAEGVALAARRGLLWMADSQEGRAWVLTDSRRVNAQARRLDGQPWARIGAKAWTLPGSEAAWPLGLPEAAEYPAIALVEGGPDCLAAFDLAVRCGVSGVVAPVTVLGAGQTLPREARPFLVGKRVRVFAHADEAGQAALRRWAGQVNGAACCVDGFTPTEGDLNDFARRTDEDHAAAMGFAAGLVSRVESDEDREARRIARELVRLYRAGAITGPDDPDAVLYAATMKVFGARYGGTRPVAAA